MKKKILATVCALVVLVGIVGGAWAATGKVSLDVLYAGITISLDGEQLELTDANGKTVEPFVVDGTTYIPVRGVFEGLGYHVSWDAENNQVVILSDLPQSIGLSNVNNARELGGYVTQDGSIVKYGKIFRTGKLSDMSQADIALMEQYDLQYIIDLRRTPERAAEPDAVISGAENIHIKFYAEAEQTADTKAEQEAESGEKAEKKNSYVQYYEMAGGSAEAFEMMFAQAFGIMLATDEYTIERYKDIFDIFLAVDEDGGSVLLHCTAGKDRTGMSVALLLSALGVDRQTIIDDYMLTNQYVKDFVDTTVAETAKELKGMDDLEEILKIVRINESVNESYIRTFFETIEQNYGTVENYLKEVIALDDAKIARLREIYTEPAN